ncbi:MAG TPA: endonuclease domain-containing protein [Caulobacteraceae bacterium]|nr:endonuclease domain-containing protein [Caulobacteraceae bacterium]
MDRPAKTQRARELRREGSDAERKLWSILCGRQLEGFKFRRQVPIDRYFADFACREAKLVVEVDGAQHLERQEYDARRTAVLEAHGWRVIRVTTTDVLTELDGVAQTISNELLLPRS